ncbi:hypothetical protein SAMD00023353_2101310 [Rosellinia necatrix]|uniref:Uncharacterized protein n=1 Tax=Rosellinia necatrix TaxID=77044 RepID=A0A1S8A7S6_ROSNE|nr:hypothetical protein SAMD00023353_2101310 [Rosellinia necatrix]
MRRKTKIRSKIDYRHRWPTQQTLVESRISVETPISKWREKLRAPGAFRFKKRWSPEPGKSTHPYDTGLCEQATDSSPSSSSSSASMLAGDGNRCWDMISRGLRNGSSPASTPKVIHASEGSRSEPPSTPAQFLRLLASPRKSPFPRSRTASSFDYDKATVKSTGSRTHTPALRPVARLVPRSVSRPVPRPALRPSTASRPTVKRSKHKKLSARLQSFARSTLKRGQDWERAARHKTYPTHKRSV